MLQACLLAQNWLTCDLDHILCQIESRSKWADLIKTKGYRLAFRLRIGLYLSWTTFWAKLKIDQNGFSFWSVDHFVFLSYIESFIIKGRENKNSVYEVNNAFI